MEIPPELKDLTREELIIIILNLQSRLMQYENSNTPPSQNNRNYPKREKSNNPVGAPKRGVKNLFQKWKCNWLEILRQEKLILILLC